MVLIFWWEQTESCIYLETRRYTNLNIKVAAWKTFRPRPLDCRAPHRCCPLSRIGDPRRPPENRASPRTPPRTHPGAGERTTKGNKANTDAYLCAPVLVFHKPSVYVRVLCQDTRKGQGPSTFSSFCASWNTEVEADERFPVKASRGPERTPLKSPNSICKGKRCRASFFFFFFFSFLWKWKSLSPVRLFRPQGLYSPWNLQARILEWAAFPFFRGSSQPRNWTGVSCIARGFFTKWATREAL